MAEGTLRYGAQKTSHACLGDFPSIGSVFLVSRGERDETDLLTGSCIDYREWLCKEREEDEDPRSNNFRVLSAVFTVSSERVSGQRRQKYDDG